MLPEQRPSATLFLGSKEPEEHGQVCIELVRALVQAGVRIIYSGADFGFMGVVGNTALQSGGYVTGVACGEFGGHCMPGTQKVETGKIEDRKAMMIWLGDIIIAFPGGFGTLDEIATAIERIKINRIKTGEQKHVIIFNVGGFYNYLQLFMEQQLRAGLINQSDLNMVLYMNTPQEIMEYIQSYYRQFLLD